jgi:hypothetical protein
VAKCILRAGGGMISLSPRPSGASSEPSDEGGLAFSLFTYNSEMPMIAQQQTVKTAIPDLRDLPLDQLAELGGTPLAHSIALYRERLKENGVPLSSFNARI